MENLSDEERDMVLRFLLRRMSMPTRHDLMRTLPMAYVAMHPGTAEEVIELVTRHAQRLN